MHENKYLAVINSKNLQSVTRFLIEEKSKKDNTNIYNIYNTVFTDEDLKDSTRIGNRAFLKLIKLFHPDTESSHKKRLDDALNVDDRKAVAMYDSIIEVITLITTRTTKVKKENIQYSENYEYTNNYEYDMDDFDDIIDYNEVDGDESVYREWNEPGFDFISAFKSTFFTNSDDLLITPAMLSMTSGYLDMSNLSISGLEGINHCIYIDRLNLSHNNIEHIDNLADLYQLKELYISNNQIMDVDALSELNNVEILDLSYNDIDDFTPLYKLQNLKFITLSNNPGDNTKIRKILTKKGIIVF